MASGTRLHPAATATLPVVVVGAAMLSCIGVCVGYPCFSTGLRYGMWVDRCPATDLRLDVEVSANHLLRGEDDGRLTIRPTASWLQGDDRHATRLTGALRRGVSFSAVLLDDQDAEIAGLTLDDWDRGGGSHWADVALPTLPDGDYVMRVHVDAGFEQTDVELDLPLYAPAIVHLMTDRPLYKPGQEVLLRSVTLKRTDQSPLEGRPGRWRIIDPEGNEMLVERDHAGPWGIADGSFPLDGRATIGTWTARWETGEQSDSVQFDVRPFRLPRFTVDVAPDERWYGIGDDLRLSGTARYTSGAPIAAAPVVVSLVPSTGRWPMPLEWEDAKIVQTGPDGKFEVDFGAVPPDLIERNTVRAIAEVTEQAGEVASGATELVLSREDLMVEAVTEFGDGLVPDYNNRAYLRISSPDGTPLGDTAIRVSNPYDPLDTGKQATTDVDGVAAIQVDPGDPVTVIRPAPPVRVRPMTQAPPALGGATEVSTGRSPTLSERRALDRLVPRLAACGDFTVGTSHVDLAVQISRGGGVQQVMADDTELARCVSTVLRSLVLPPGVARTFRLSWQIHDSQRPWLQSAGGGAARGDTIAVTPVLADARARARRCLSTGQGMNNAPVMTIHWSITEGSRTVRTSVETTTGHGLSAGALACVQGRMFGLSLAEPAKQDAMGADRLSLRVPRPPGSATPQPTTSTAYELLVERTDEDAQTRMVLPVGIIPPLRLRATPSLSAPGEQVTIDLLRGPAWSGALPEELGLYEGSRRVDEQDVVDKKVTFTIPADADGFLHVDYGGARSVIFVQRDDRLAVSVTTPDDAYRPGDDATLTVTTTAGSNPVAAGVGLVGVDNALGQLAPLLAPDDFGRVTVRATSDQPAFGAFDPRALTLGEVKGENAAKAAVLRITHVPMDPAGDSAVAANETFRADTVEPLTQGFYRALEHTIGKVRTWEASAPEAELMENAQMVTLWNETLATLAGQGQPALDGYGRTLTLAVLPEDLLVQVDPRSVVADGTRLPEDVVAWTRFVDEEVVR